MILFLGLVGCNYDGEIADGPGEEDKEVPVGPSSPTEPSDKPVVGYRPKTASSSVNCSVVYEYMPAPGQFINELKAMVSNVVTEVMRQNPTQRIVTDVQEQPKKQPSKPKISKPKEKDIMKKKITLYTISYE